MSSIDYHGALGELAAACDLTDSDIALVVNPLQGIKIGGVPPRSMLGRALWKTGIFLRHLFLPWRILRQVRNRVIILREFSSLPLLAVSPFLLPLRKKLVFTVNHNMQWAIRSRGERIAFQLLDRFGFRFMFFETLDCEGVRQLGLNATRHWEIPHPVEKQQVQRSGKTPFTVGIVGHYRAEKGVDEALDILQNNTPSFRLIVGIPNIENFTKGSRHGTDDPWFELRNTSSPKAYYSTLSECDVVLLCYTSEGYQFRASGLVADAVACGATVLTPDFPIMRHQIEYPTVIGMCYSDLTEIPSLILNMSKNRDNYSDAIANYLKGRSSTALARLLDRMIG